MNQQWEISQGACFIASQETNNRYLILWNNVTGEVDQTAELWDDTNVNQDGFIMFLLKLIFSLY